MLNLRPAERDDHPDGHLAADLAIRTKCSHGRNGVDEFDGTNAGPRVTWITGRGMNFGK